MVVCGFNSGDGANVEGSSSGVLALMVLAVVVATTVAAITMVMSDKCVFVHLFNA